MVASGAIRGQVTLVRLICSRRSVCLVIRETGTMLGGVQERLAKLLWLPKLENETGHTNAISVV
jgi:hypothetical protein